jgi:hypothetical protein
MLHVVASPPPLPLPPSHRRRALDDLERLIERAEAELGRHLATVERSAADGAGPCPARGDLRLAERRLATLRHSRELLLLAGGTRPEDHRAAA